MSLNLSFSFVYTAIHNLLVGSLLGACVFCLPAAAINSSTSLTSKSVNSDANPTASLQLIDLNNTEGDVENQLSLAEMLDAADQIDNVMDTSALDDEINTDIPVEVDNVSLNAISPNTLKTFVAVVDLVRREYVDTVNDETLFNNAMSGMLTKLDSHAEFLDAEAYDNLRAFTEGDVGSVGLKAAYQPEVGYWVVTQVADDSPADKKGISTGDYLHQIDEFKLDSDQQSNDIEQRLSGIAGTQVDVVISKAGRRKRTISLQRNNHSPQVIETRLVDGIAVIKIPAFQNNTREMILQSLIRLDLPVSGILLDVRDNPGGVLQSAISVASLFMSDTDVVQVNSRNKPVRTLTTMGSAILEDLPVVVLQNRYSASAAEVLASSLQAQNRAKIVGEVSYGKGSVQSVIPLNDEQAVKLTVAHYLTAAGGKIESIGVEPDVSLKGSESTWETQALMQLREQARVPGIRFARQENPAIASGDGRLP